MKLTKTLAIGLGATFIAAFAIATPAVGDPVTNSYALVGSDTLQDSSNALANGSKVTGSWVRVKADGASIGSFNAFGSATIQTKPGGNFFTRPSGSGEGIKALSASIQKTTYKGVDVSGQVDIARTSSGWGNNKDDNNGLLAFIPYGRDAVSYAYVGDSAKLGSLTIDQLKQIYNGDLTSIDGVTLHPMIPQASSGTRKFFLAAIGVSSSAACPLAICSDTSNATAENDASVLGATDGTIIPFSAASWVAQANAAAPSTIPASGAVKMGSPAGVAPFTGSGSNLVPNATFYSSSTWGRDTYLVVEYARINPASAKFDQGLFNLVNPTSATSLTDFSSTPTSAGAVKLKFGFLAPASTTVTRAYATYPSTS